MRDIGRRPFPEDTDTRRGGSLREQIVSLVGELRTRPVGLVLYPNSRR